MDIKFIGSGYTAHAVLYYITDYISKTQLKTHIAYNTLEIALHHLNRFDSDGDVPADVRAKRILISDPKLGCATGQKDRNRTGPTLVATKLQLPV